MSKAIINDSTLTSIANAIRSKGGTAASLTPAQMPTAIAAIETGGPTEVKYDTTAGELYVEQDYVEI